MPLKEVYGWPDEVCLRLNFVSTLDGAVALDGRTSGLSTVADRAVFDYLRTTCDVVLVGATTAISERYRPARVPIAVVSGQLSPGPSDPLFAAVAGTATPIVLTCEQAPSDRRNALAAYAEVVSCGDETVDLQLVLDELKRRGMRRILCEGGPTLFAQLLASGLADELCLTLAPLLTAGSAPRITDGEALRPPRGASLLSVLEQDDTVLLRYSLR